MVNKRVVKTKAIILIASFCFASSSASADAIRDANRLLRVTDLGSRFESMALNQSRMIIRTYASIVNMNASVSLPQSVKKSIAECYAEAYAWEQFEPGIAKIFADNLTRNEIALLIDFYNDLGHPPSEIVNFKNTLTKAEQIEFNSIEYIFNNSKGCLERDAEIINNYLASQNVDSSEYIRLE